MRLAAAVVALACLAGTALAQEDTLAGFRLLELDDRPVSWQPAKPGEPIVVSYAFITSPMTFPGAINCGRMLPPEALLERSTVDMKAMREELNEAFRLWEQVARITFREVADPKDANILVGAQAEPKGRAFSNVFWRTTAGAKTGAIDRALICLNPKVRWKIGFDGNLNVYDLRYTFAHEIGHAIGLDHPGPAGQLMSFRYDERHTYLQAGDVAGAARIYGRPSNATASSDPVAPAPEQRPVESASTGSERSLGIGETRLLSGLPKP